MTFDAWINMAGETNASVGKRLGRSGETIRRYRSGEREPDLKMMAAVHELSDGLVTPNDWVGITSPTAPAAPAPAPNDAPETCGAKS